MKILEAVREAGRNRVATLDRVQATCNLYEAPSYIAACEIYLVRYQLDVGLEVTCPLDALEVVKERAVRAIADEVYGELYRDLYELQKLLWEENVYRPEDSPVLSKLTDIFSKIRP